MPSSIMTLCKPSLPRDGNPFLGDTAPPRLKPICLERVLEGKPLPAASSSLLLLPSTVWDIILEYLDDDRETLANLALVSSMCNLLAKSVQFCSVHLTYSDNALEMLTFLAERALFRQEEQTEGYHQGPTLGAFIREIVVRTNPDHIASRHKFGACLPHANHVYGLDITELADRIQWGDDFYFEDYIGCISHVVEMGAVPNLFTFDWRDRVTIPETLIQSLLRSPAKELKIGGFVNLLVPRCPNDDVTSNIEVRSLTLHGITEPDGSNDGNGGEGSAHHHPNHHLLTLTAPTLETLCFTRTPKSSCEHLFPNLSAQPEFPQLRVLMLGAPFSKTSTTTLLGANLRTLIIDGIGILSYRQAGHLRGIGHMPTLRALICRRRMQGGRTVIPSFLSQNPQLTKLVLHTSHLEEILEVIAKHLHNLTSLSLVTQMPASPLSVAALTPRHGQLLSQLHSLEQLHLSISPEGELVVYDHTLLRESLRHLPNLRKLALTQDTYHRVGHEIGSWPASRYYYSNGKASSEEIGMARERPHLEPEGFDYDKLPDRMLFELAHRNAMLDLAEYHGDVLKKLGFVYIGQRAISLSRKNTDGRYAAGDVGSVDGDGNIETIATPLTESREELLTYLHNTWGCHVETWGWDY